jgi:hypothetical protein
MPAGDLPDGQPTYQKFLHPTTDTPTDGLLFEKFGFIFQKLCEQCCTINVLIQATYNNKEKSAVLQLSKLNHQIYSTSLSNLNNSEITELYKNCKFYSTNLWKQLEKPSTFFIRNNLIQFITVLDLKGARPKLFLTPTET